MQPSRPASPAPAPKFRATPRSAFLTREPALPPVLSANRVVFWTAVSCLGVLALFLLARLFISADSAAYPLVHRMSASLLLAALQYGLIAWHTRSEPQSFGLGLATSCSVWVSTMGLVTVPMMFLGLARAPGPNEPQHQVFSGFTELALLLFLFVLANFILLVAALRTTWLAREEDITSLSDWAFGFFLPLLLLFVLRAIAAASL